MNERETLEKAEVIVINKETEYLKGLLDKYQIAQEERDDEKLDKILTKICREKKRLDPIDKYDEEEVTIARLVRSKR